MKNSGFGAAEHDDAHVVVGGQLARPSRHLEEQRHGEQVDRRAVDRDGGDAARSTATDSAVRIPNRSNLRTLRRAVERPSSSGDQPRTAASERLDLALRVRAGRLVHELGRAALGGRLATRSRVSRGSAAATDPDREGAGHHQPVDVVQLASGAHGGWRGAASPRGTASIAVDPRVQRRAATASTGLRCSYSAWYATAAPGPAASSTRSLSGSSPSSSTVPNDSSADHSNPGVGTVANSPAPSSPRRSQALRAAGTDQPRHVDRALGRLTGAVDHRHRSAVDLDRVAVEQTLAPGARTRRRRSTASASGRARAGR